MGLAEQAQERSLQRRQSPLLSPCRGQRITRVVAGVAAVAAVANGTAIAPGASFATSFDQASNSLLGGTVIRLSRGKSYFL